MFKKKKNVLFLALQTLQAPDLSGTEKRNGLIDLIGKSLFFSCGLVTVTVFLSFIRC